MTAAEDYAGPVDALAGQRTRWRGGRRGDRWSPILAEQARDDPHRPLDENLRALASYIDPDDVVVDVGGGAGRVCLPLALRCREVVNVDPAPAMQAAFERSAQDAGIANVRFVRATWPTDPPVRGDVVLATQVTYFVRDIVPFVQQLDAAARRRVIIGIWSVPPPVQGEAVFELLFGGPFVRPPGHRELLPVLWDLGILPDVRVLPMPMRRTYAWPPQPTREQMVEWAVRYVVSLGAVTEPDARAKITAHFDELFVQDADGYRPHWPPDVREMLITWEPRR
jgi:SAM-dependent methyltransferase